ncbi:DEAD/DEAH box helicase [Microbispora sp. NPDC049633]|uniref:DEAD/DEAH box helicase n=1 Tax=Microbispora sp. NPDC049633 TaxID=3154355 RepID=UPI00341318B1
MLLTTLHASYQDPDLDYFLDRGNLLLAYDMGLGKTILSIAAAEELIARGEVGGDAGPALIVCPSGLKLQWAAAIARHTDVATKEITSQGETFLVPEDRYAVVLDGGPEQRRELYKQIEETRPDYVIAGYQTVANELRMFRRMKAAFIVLDEGTAIKNPAADVTKAVRRLTAPWRLMLTGTPVDRILEDLLHLMAWVDVTILGDPDDEKQALAFDRAYLKRNHWGKVVGYKNMDVLHRKVAPALIRRRTTDPEVAPHMPKVKHGRWTVHMGPETQVAYRHIMEDLAYELQSLPARTSLDLGAYYRGEPDEKTTAGRVMAVHLAAQQFLDDPKLLADSPSPYAKAKVDEGLLDNVGDSAKMHRLVAAVPAILANPEAKVIIVSRFRGMVSRLQKTWPEQSVVYHGEMNAAQKQAAVNRFQTDPTKRIFLMSHAGAYGVDIPIATHLINVDPARSAGQRAQINHRHVRASSTHAEVQVIDMVTAGTIEERAYERLELRKKVGAAAVDGVGADARGEIEDTVGSLTEHVEAVLAA